jgi:hypothetical protein
MLKLVACTKVYKNVGNNEMPMWRCVDGNEYIVSRFNKEPKWKDVGKAISKFQHILETESLTHGENFQLRNGGTIDFPAKDIEEIDVTEAMDGIKGL